MKTKKRRVETRKFKIKTEFSVDGASILLPIFVPPKASLKIVGGLALCLSAVTRRLAGGSMSRLRLGCSTGNTRLRFFGNLERA